MKLFNQAMLVVWQVVRELLALDNEVVVQIDAHDTLWGETGMFCFNPSLHVIVSFFFLALHHTLILEYPQFTCTHI